MCDKLTFTSSDTKHPEQVWWCYGTSFHFSVKHTYDAAAAVRGHNMSVIASTLKPTLLPVWGRSSNTTSGKVSTNHLLNVDFELIQEIDKIFATPCDIMQWGVLQYEVMDLKNQISFLFPVLDSVLSVCPFARCVSDYEVSIFIWRVLQVKRSSYSAELHSDGWPQSREANRL